jgi:HEPN domain
MDGRAFLDVARRLSQEPTEADWRSAAGGSYYALLLEGKSALRRWEFPPPPRDQLHRFVRLSFVYAADLDLKKIGQVLEDLSKLRNQADYEPERSGAFASAASARRAVHAAQTAIDLLDQIERDASRRSAAIAAIRPPP